jgi:predicted Zn-dependent protease with MMP-like domain
MARTEAELRRIVTDTVWHEVGHYFGLDERQVHAIEDRRERLRGLRAIVRRQ